MNNKLTYLAFCLSLISIVMSLIIIAIWLLNASEVAIISLDTFIGVIVAIMALLVTIVLGWQIYNAVEIKEKINATDILKNELERLKHELQQSQHNIQHSEIYHAFYHSTLMGLGAGSAKDFVTAFRFLHNALYLSLQADKTIELKATLSNLHNCANAIRQGQEVSKAFIEYIQEMDIKIRSAAQYDLCREEYEHIYDLFISKVSISKQ